MWITCGIVVRCVYSLAFERDGPGLFHQRSKSNTPCRKNDSLRIKNWLVVSIFFLFTRIWVRFPIVFRGVGSTTNQKNINKRAKSFWGVELWWCGIHLSDLGQYPSRCGSLGVFTVVSRVCRHVLGVCLGFQILEIARAQLHGQPNVKSRIWLGRSLCTEAWISPLWTCTYHIVRGKLYRSRFVIVMARLFAARLMAFLAAILKIHTVLPFATRRHWDVFSGHNGIWNGVVGHTLNVFSMPLGYATSTLHNLHALASFLTPLSQEGVEKNCIRMCQCQMLCAFCFVTIKNPGSHLISFRHSLEDKITSWRSPNAKGWSGSGRCFFKEIKVKKLLGQFFTTGILHKIKSRLSAIIIQESMHRENVLIL